MLILISPAKTLDFSPQRAHAATKPVFLPQANRLARLVKQLSPAELGALMSISPKLAEAVHGYFKSWKSKHDAPGAKEAIFAFRGDVYLGLEADELSANDLAFAQDHLRILSGLYGVLRPLDLIQPYRLVMGSQLASPHGNNLYDYWDDSIRKGLMKELARHEEPVIVNLASQEYFAAANAKRLRCRVITPSFRDRHDNQYKVISFFAKKARGMMARYLIAGRIDAPEEIQKFRAGGYHYNRELSNDDQPVFTRDK